MKKYLTIFEKDELESLLKNIKQNINNFKFNEEIESIIQL